MSWNPIFQWINEPLFILGKVSLSLLGIVRLALVLILFVLLARLTRRFIRKHILVRTRFNAGLQYAISRIAGYAVLMLGFGIGLQTIGVDLSSLAVIIGALGVGIGLGLQTIVNNFVSGLILLADRAIQLGDRIEIGGTTGRVMKIGARATSILTNDNIVMIVPNSEFVTTRVVNWSHAGDMRIRVRVPFGVSYNSDPHLVEKLLEKVALENPHALKEPPPKVVFLNFGESSLNFELRVWTDQMTHQPGRFRSEIYFAAWKKFKEYGVEIPFPQQEIHLKQPVQIELKRSLSSRSSFSPLTSHSMGTRLRASTPSSGRHD